MALPEQRGVEIARQVIDTHSPQHQAVLERVLARYAQSPGLSDDVRYELFLYAIQWRQDALADTLQKGIGKANGQSRMVEVMNACLRGKQAQCLASIEVLEPGISMKSSAVPSLRSPGSTGWTAKPTAG